MEIRKYSLSFPFKFQLVSLYKVFSAIQLLFNIFLKKIKKLISIFICNFHLYGLKQNISFSSNEKP